jgi:glycosyltransferase involved in cell wall biosynthesis
VPLVVSPHGMLAPWALAWRRQRKALAWTLYQRRLLAGAAALLATAPAEAADIAARLPGACIGVLPNGVALPDAAPPPGELAAQVLFLGRLHPVKNLPGLLAAWALVAPRFPGWRLRLVGPEEAGHRALLIAEAARLGIGASVAIDPAIPDSEKAQAFAAASLFVLPSFTENFGVVAAEALAAGLPVIASTGTPWAALPAAGAGWHVAPDPESLAAALAEAMALAPAQRAAMGARGAALAAKEFGWTRIAERLLAIYRWLLAGQPADARPEALYG